MESLEIPLGKRTKRYRFFEMLPALLSYTILLLPFVLSFFSPFLASIYVLLVIFGMFVKAIRIGWHTVRGYRWYGSAIQVDWHQRLMDLADPQAALERLDDQPDEGFNGKQHLANIHKVLAAPQDYPAPSSITHVVIVTAYNEPLEVIEPTIQALIDTTVDKQNLIIAFAYEARGGKGIEQTAHTLQQRYGHKFAGFYLVKHPADLPGEVVGKGGNITYAGKYIAKLLRKEDKDPAHVMVTTLDCDNRPHPTYFDYVSYSYIMQPNRKQSSYQPISLFLNNIWDVPAPMRVIATGNSFWNLIVASRTDKLRNFASHSQPLSALIDMNFWSTRTIVEDGHQYWRSYFFFKGEYNVVPIYVPIYQDAVLGETYTKTLYAQFKQLRRWSYGASDIAYVGAQVFNKNRPVPLLDGFVKFWELVDGHISMATMSIIIAVGGWIPLLFNPDSTKSLPAHQLPNVVSSVQMMAMIGLIITIFISLKMLPPRPARYKRHRSLLMLAQWVLMPVTSILYGALAGLNAQTRLLCGRYLDKFDVTEKVAATSVRKINYRHWWQWWTGGRGDAKK